MSEWREATISEIVTLIGGGTPKTSVSEYWDGQIPWLSVVDFNNEKKYVFDTEKRITEDGLKNSSTKLLEKGDIIISARGTVGVVAMLGKQMAFNQSCYGVKANENSTNEYVYYLLKDRVSNFIQYSHGGVFDTITRDTFNEIDVLLPPLEEQNAIAEVLSSLDDKIDLLQRQNQTLEQLAETLFRQWFVENFDNAQYVKLGKLVDTVDNRGKTPPWTQEKTEFPLIEVNALGNWLVDYSKIKKYVVQETYHSWFRAHPKKYDTILSTVGSIGEFSMFVEELGSIAQNVVAFQAKGISPFYLYQTLKFFSLDIKEFDIGSVQPSIKVSHLREYEVPVFTNSKYLKEFDNISIDICSKLEANQTQIRTLASLRDTLLPKLMSGEVRVEMDVTNKNRRSIYYDR